MAIKEKQKEVKKCQYCGKEMVLRTIEIGDIKMEVWVYQCDCIKKYQRLSQAHSLLDHSRIDNFFVKNKLKNEMIEKYIRKFKLCDKKNKPFLLFIYGNPGTGKTTFACSFAIELIYKFLISVRYYRSTELLSLLSNDYTNVFYESKMVNLLIIDNLAISKQEGYRNLLFDLIDYRIHNNKNLILITNAKKSELEDIFPQAFISRLKYFEKLPFVGKDLRENKKEVKNDLDRKRSTKFKVM